MTDPYDQPEKRGVYDTVIGGLRNVNLGLTTVLGAAFVLAGIGILIWAAFSAEPFLLPMGALVLLLGAARLLPLVLRRGR